jgi:hypothetical protein
MTGKNITLLKKFQDNIFFKNNLKRQHIEYLDQPELICQIHILDYEIVLTI